MSNIAPFGTPFPMRQKTALMTQKINGLMDKIEVLTKQHIGSNFVAQGFIDQSVKKWPPRKKMNKDAVMTAAGDRMILVKTGKLARSIVTMSKTNRRLVIGSNLPYSGVHNRTVGEMKKYHGANYPGRKFMGHSRALVIETVKTIIRDINAGAIFRVK